MRSACFAYYLAVLGGIFLHALKSYAQWPMQTIHGLSQNTVYAITEDRLGFLWIGTGRGINRFDGREIKHYLPSDSGLAGRFIRNGFLLDQSDRLWFASEQGTQFMNRKKGTIHTPYIWIDGKRWPLHGTFPLHASDQEISLVNESSGLWIYNPEQERGSKLGLPQWNHQDVPLRIHGCVDEQIRYWFATARGLAFFDRRTNQWNWLTTNHHFDAVASRGNQVWACGDGWLYLIEAARIVNRWRIPRVTHRGSIQTIHVDPYQRIWIGDDQGNLYQWNGLTNAISWILNINPAPLSGSRFPIYSLYVSSEGSLWVGTDVLGLIRINPHQQQFNLIRPNTSTASESLIQSILPTSDGQVWMGVFQQGLMAYNEHSKSWKTRYRHQAPTTPNPNYALAQADRWQRTWFFAGGKLFMTTADKGQSLKIALPVHPKLATSAGMVVPYAFVPEPWGGWLGTSIGLYRIQISEKTGIAEHIHSVGYTTINSLWKNANQQELWLGLESGGVGLVDLQQKNLRVRYLAGQQRNTVSQFWKDEQWTNLIWAATLHGLLAIHTPSKTYQRYGIDDGLPSDYLHAVVRHRDQIWVAAQGGLARGVLTTNPSRPRFPSIRFDQFGKGDGLASTAFHQGAVAYEPERGRIWLGTSQGAIHFLPDSIQPSIPKPIVRLVDVHVNEQPIDSLLPEFITALRLSSQERQLHFRFSAIRFSDKSEVQYRYRLTGWDKDWIYSGGLPEVRYIQVAPGNYQFDVQARLGGRPWGDSTRILVFIDPPFWQKPWFYFPSIVLAFTGLIFFVRFLSQRRLKDRLRELEQQRALEEERQRISREMHDDIGSGLTRITLWSDTLAREHPTEKAHQIAGMSRQLVGNMSEIIWSLNQDNSHLADLLAYLREQLSTLLEDHFMQAEIDLDVGERNPLLNFRQKRNIALLVKEAVHNAIKHSGCTEIKIRSKWLENSYWISVEDNGTGLPTATNKRGNGFQNMAYRCQELNCTQEIHSQPNKGTQLCWYIPFDNRNSR